MEDRDKIWWGIVIVLLIIFLVICFAAIIPSFNREDYWAFAGWILADAAILTGVGYLFIRKAKSRGVIQKILD